MYRIRRLLRSYVRLYEYWENVDVQASYLLEKSTDGQWRAQRNKSAQAETRQKLPAQGDRHENQKKKKNKNKNKNKKARKKEVRGREEKPLADIAMRRRK
jgi:hypothetical protein